MTTATPTEKPCTKCGEVKPLADYHRKAESRDGYRADCKACASASQKTWREANKDRIAARDKAWYETNKEQVLAQHKAYREANTERIAARKRAYYEANRDEIAARNKAWREANKAQIAARRKSWYEANREEVIARVGAYREANKEQIATQQRAYRVANADEVAARKKAYREANREQIAAYKQAWYAEKWANDPEYRARCKAAQTRYYRLLANAKQEPYARDEIFARDGWTCGICDEPIDPTIRYEDDPRACATIDHVIPLSRGGDDTPANVQAAHGSCNYGKCDRVEHEDLEVAA